MEYLQLANTGLKVSRLVFGCEQLAGVDWGKCDEHKLRSAVLRAVELGVNTFDVADVYGLGRAEEILSQTLGSKRHDLNIVTKCGVRWSTSVGGQRAKTSFDSSAKYIVNALENSLRRLRVDCIPMYLIHWPDPNTPIEESMEVLLNCQRVGKIKYFGISNYSVEQLQQVLAFTDVSIAEFQYNLLDRSAERGILPYCSHNGLLSFTYGALAQGFLTGKYALYRQFSENDRRHRLPHFQKNLRERGLKLLSRLESQGARLNRTLPQVALRWILDKQDNACAIFGAKSPNQVDDNIGAIGWRLRRDQIQYLDT
jgi:aryl-alcohol dehydrogenase-like predicted oxidoreductase